jgi:dolichol kinase
MTAQSIWRNLFHFSGIVIPLAYLFINKGVALSLTICLFCAVLVVEFLRITGRLRLGIIGKCLKPKEEKRPSGSVHYMLSALAAILLFDKRVVIPSLFILSISDPLSSLVGRRLGRHPLLGKSLEGTLVFLASSLIILILFSVRPFVAIPVSLIVTLTELFTPGFLDDNLTIPIVSALVLTILGA